MAGDLGYAKDPDLNRFFADFASLPAKFSALLEVIKKDLETLKSAVKVNESLLKEILNKIK